MRAIYRILGFLIAFLVMVQAAVIAWAVFGEAKWVEDGGVVTADLVEAVQEGEQDAPFPEVLGYMLHGLVGMIVIPAVALILLIVSFFVRVKGTTWLALAVFGLVVLQVALGLFSFDLPFLGLLHGLNALILFVGALHAVRRAKKPAEPEAPDATPQPAAL